jgi:hypothetical protein
VESALPILRHRARHATPPRRYAVTPLRRYAVTPLRRETQRISTDVPMGAFSKNLTAMVSGNRMQPWEAG